MNGDREKAATFVRGLLANPTLADFNPLQKEEQVLQFLDRNQKQLLQALAAPAFFPGRSWQNIRGLVGEALAGAVDAQIEPALRDIIEKRMDLGFVAQLRRQAAPPGEIRGQLYAFAWKLLRRPESRRAFAEAFTALSAGLADRYIECCFREREYVHFELTKVQRLRMEVPELSGLLACTLLLKQGLQLLDREEPRGENGRPAGTIQAQEADRVLQRLKRELNLLPDQVLECAAHANLSFAENRFMEASSRMAAIFSARARAWRANLKVDRGADTPDKSWFSVSRRNHRFFGFDIKMLDEFYRIAAENNW